MKRDLLHSQIGTTLNKSTQFLSLITNLLQAKSQKKDIQTKKI